MVVLKPTGSAYQSSISASASNCSSGHQSSGKTRQNSSRSVSPSLSLSSTALSPSSDQRSSSAAGLGLSSVQLLSSSASELRPSNNASVQQSSLGSSGLPSISISHALSAYPSATAPGLQASSLGQFGTRSSAIASPTPITSQYGSKNNTIPTITGNGPRLSYSQYAPSNQSSMGGPLSAPSSTSRPMLSKSNNTSLLNATRLYTHNSSTQAPLNALEKLLHPQNRLVNMTGHYGNLSYNLTSLNKYEDECLLWDNSCKGNKSEALNSFFNNTGAMFHLVHNAHCIWNHYGDFCYPWLPPGTVMPKLLGWMRDSQCIADFNEWHDQHPDAPPWVYSTRQYNGWDYSTIDFSSQATTTASIGCCGRCTVAGGNVDVYYWPAPTAKTDCLATVGSVIQDPMSGNRITDSRGYPYWKPQTNPYAPAGGSITASPLSTILPAPQALPGNYKPNVNPLNEAPVYITARELPITDNSTITGNLSNPNAAHIATIGTFEW